MVREGLEVEADEVEVVEDMMVRVEGFLGGVLWLGGGIVRDRECV